MLNTRILIVEDEKIVARDIQHRLGKLGYSEPVIASTGEEALRKAAQMRPDIILMDIMLSRGLLDGVDVALELRKSTDIPVIYLTAYADAHSLARAKVTEPYGYILKPFQTRELHITIEVALNKHRMEKQLKESKHLLSITLASIGDGVIAVDGRGKVTFMNRVAERLTGCSAPEAAGRPISEVFTAVREHSRVSILNPLADLLSDALPDGSEMILVSRDGAERPVEISASSVGIARIEESSGAVLVFRDITERRMAEEWVRYLAYHDVLTGLPNRSLLFQKVSVAMAQTRRHGRRMAFLSVDLDQLEHLGASHGPGAADAILRSLAERISSSVREDDIVVRLEGDRFIIVLNDMAGSEDIVIVAEKLLSALREPFVVDGARSVLAASIGISEYPAHGDSIDDLIRAAATAMRAAKKGGKNSFVVYEPVLGEG